MEGSQRLAVVTGGAHRIGRAIALGLGEAGFDVLVHYHRSETAAAETVREIEALGQRAWAAAADLTRSEEVEDLFRRRLPAPGRLDLLVNSAAGFDSGRLGSIGASGWDRALALTLRAPAVCLEEALPGLRRAAEMGGAPSVINIADLSGVQGWPSHVAHSVAKAGLIHLTRTAALALAPDIRVSAVVPGAILPAAGTEETSEEWRRAAARVPLSRTGDAASVSAAVLYLVGARFVTGEVLYVDGGEHLVHSRDPGGAQAG